MKIATLFFACLLGMSAASGNEPASPEEMLRWFNENDEAKIAAVSEGELRFLPETGDDNLLHSINTLIIDSNSIDTGWVKLHQCYRHLDPVPSAEVVYRYKQIRGLRLESHRNIRSARVIGQSVQLDNVGKNAELCIRAEVRIFYLNKDGSFSLVNGPFHRKFLDGYYPYHVTLNIHYPAEQFLFLHTVPAPQPGFSVTRKANTVLIDSYFEGVLNTETFFRLR